MELLKGIAAALLQEKDAACLGDVYKRQVSDSEKIKPYDILEISCNEEILDVVIKNSDSGTIEPQRHKWPCFYNISKIRKSDFPYEPRDFLMHAVQ